MTYVLGYGVSVDDEIEGVTFVNASTVNHGYRVVNKPIMFYVKGRGREHCDVQSLWEREKSDDGDEEKEKDAATSKTPQQLKAERKQREADRARRDAERAKKRLALKAKIAEQKKKAAEQLVDGHNGQIEKMVEDQVAIEENAKNLKE